MKLNRGRSSAGNQFPLALLAGYALVWIGLAIAPKDRWAWTLENLLVVPFVAMLVLTHRRFAFSSVSSLLIALYLGLHAVGAHYSYVQTPLGEWLKEAFDLRRNPFDRIGHCAFGLLLASPFREILGRLAKIRGALIYWLPVAAVLALSSVFEIVEALVAEVVSPGTGPQWLDAQGDSWDMQMDMLAALAGAALAMLLGWVFARSRCAPRALRDCGSPLEQMSAPSFQKSPLLQTLAGLYAAVWIVTAVHPVDRSDWLLENLLVFAFVAVLLLTYRRLPLSNLSYVLLFVFLLLHAAGAHYKYSEVPIGYWLKETFDLSRNHFDRIVHLSFGLLLTYPARDVLTRVASVRGFWAWGLPTTVVVSLSGFFEIVEAVVAWNVKPELGIAYLGTQGDIWDAQKDMALAILGAGLAVIVFVKVCRLAVCLQPTRCTRFQPPCL